MEAVERPSSAQYDENYFQRHCGAEPYARNEVWLGHFRRVAERMVADFDPGTVLDVGCAWGFLVESLRDNGVEAYGIDVSEYALQQARPDIRPYCTLASATETLTRDYDLIVCIEVLEHLSPAEAEAAVGNFCAHAQDVVFSSTADDFDEPTHINVRGPEYWSELFARHGFVRDLDYEAPFISPAAVRFKGGKPSLHRVVRDYERVNAQLTKENQAVRAALIAQEARLTERDRELVLAQQHIDNVSDELEKLRGSLPIYIAQRWFPPHSLRGTLLRRAFRRVLH